MKLAKIIPVLGISALLLWAGGSAALASGHDPRGPLGTALAPANGPVYTDEVITEGPSRVIEVQRRSIRMKSLDPRELAEAQPEAFIGTPWSEAGEGFAARR